MFLSDNELRFLSEAMSEYLRMSGDDNDHDLFTAEDWPVVKALTEKIEHARTGEPATASGERRGYVSPEEMADLLNRLRGTREAVADRTPGNDLARDGKLTAQGYLNALDQVANELGLTTRRTVVYE